MIKGLFGSTKVLEKALDGSWMRGEAISQNIANVDTPGYKKKTVSFEQALGEAIDSSGFKGFRTDKRHIPIGSTDFDSTDIKVTQDNASLSMRLDGNNVDVDSEMALMAKNNIMYNTLIQKVSGEFRKLKSVISEGRR